MPAMSSDVTNWPTSARSTCANGWAVSRLGRLLGARVRSAVRDRWAYGAQTKEVHERGYVVVRGRLPESLDALHDLIWPASPPFGFPFANV
eukprot:366199-Chlamydomonas_euryale.AAC.26